MEMKIDYQHSYLDDAMERRASIAKALGALGELEKVLGCLGDSLRKRTT